MKRITSALLLLALWLGACTSTPVNTPAESTEPAAADEPALTENSEQAEAKREAVISEFENEVVVKAATEGEFIPAEVGFIFQQGGSLQTGDNSRARLDLMPEGTIIRVAPNSAFTLPEITEAEGAPKTTISMFFGKIFVLLNGGSLDVQTPSGVASVRGSLLSISFNPETGRVQAACLEGHCSLQNEDGEEIELVEGESAYVNEDGEVLELDGIDQDEVQEWLDEAPELSEFLEEIPDPENYPDLEDFEEFNFDPEAYYEEVPTDDSGFYDLDEEDMLSTSEPEATEDPGGEEGDPPPDDGSGDDGSGD